MNQVSGQHLFRSGGGDARPLCPRLIGLTLSPQNDWVPVRN